MTVVLDIYGGRPKRDIIEMALEFCGLAGYQFQLTPEEIASTLRLLDTMMAEWPWKLLGYNAADYGAGLPEDESGLSEEDIPAVFMALAQRRAPLLGAQLPQEARGAMSASYNSVCSRMAVMPTALISPSSVRGSGTRRLTPFITETGD
jgi:hypothetical protein